MKNHSNIQVILKKTMRDIDYFKEELMENISECEFFKRLPKYMRSACAYRFAGVLQGWAGPTDLAMKSDSENIQPINDIQEVKFWFSISKHYHWVPIVGQITFVTVRSLNYFYEWDRYFFDAGNGKFLTNDINEANKLLEKNKTSDEYKEKGSKLFNENKLQEASVEFEMARDTAVTDSYYNTNELKRVQTIFKAFMLKIDVNSEKANEKFKSVLIELRKSNSEQSKKYQMLAEVKQ